MSEKVGVFYRLDQYGGVQSCVISLVKALNSRGVRPTLVWDLPPSQEILNETGIEVDWEVYRVPFGSKFVARLPAMLRYLPLALNAVGTRRYSRRFDVMFLFANWFIADPSVRHVYYSSGPPLLPQLDPVETGLRGALRSFQRGLYHWLIRPFLPAYEVHPGSPYFINSRFTAELLKEAHGVEVPVAYPPIPIRDLIPPVRAAERRSVVFFSRLVDYKRPEWVLEIARRHPDLPVKIMGGGVANREAYLQELRAACAALPNVELLENPSTPVVKRTLAEARFYVFPAVNEHFGMTTVEAIAAGAVPFVHNSGGQREIVPPEALRFDDPDFHSKFDALLALPAQELEALRKVCEDHMWSFDESEFQRKMLSVVYPSEITHA